MMKHHAEPGLPGEPGVLRREVHRQHDHEHHDEHVRHARPVRHRGDVGAPFLFGELVGEVRVLQVPDRQRDAERRQDPAEDDVVGQLDHAEAQPGQHDHVQDDVREQPEEAVPVPAAPTTVPPALRSSWFPPARGCCRYALPSPSRSVPRRHPAEDAALRLDHRERGGLELGKVRGRRSPRARGTRTRGRSPRGPWCGRRPRS